MHCSRVTLYSCNSCHCLDHFQILCFSSWNCSLLCSVTNEMSCAHSSIVRDILHDSHPQHYECFLMLHDIVSLHCLQEKFPPLQFILEQYLWHFRWFQNDCQRNIYCSYIPLYPSGKVPIRIAVHNTSHQPSIPVQGLVAHTTHQVDCMYTQTVDCHIVYTDALIDTKQETISCCSRGKLSGSVQVLETS